MIIKTQCFVIKRDLEEMGIPQDDIPVAFSFLINQVESVREVIEEGIEVDPNKCRVIMKSGDETTINIPYNDLLKTWEESLK